MGGLGSAVGLTSVAGEAANTGVTTAIGTELAAASAAAAAVGSARIPMGNEETSAGAVINVGADLAQAQSMITLAYQQIMSRSAAKTTHATGVVVLDEAGGAVTTALASGISLAGAAV